MATPQTLTHSLASILRSVRIVSRQSSHTRRGSLVKTKLLLIAVIFFATFVEPFAGSQFKYRGQGYSAALRFALQPCFEIG